MMSLVAVLVLSFVTLCLGTYVADRVEHRCPSCAEPVSDATQRTVNE